MKNLRGFKFGHCHKDFGKVWKINKKYTEGPKDTVLFNCVFWEKATSSTGWKCGT